MSDENLKPAEQAMDPFSIFNTNVEDITSFEENEGRDWSKTFYEQNPEKGQCTALVKLITNIFNSNDPAPLRVTYSLPDPDNPSLKYTFVSPTSVGQKCPVMSKWWDMYQKGKAGDLMYANKAKQLSRKRYRASVIQIINDLKEPENNYKLRLLKYPVEFDVDKLITTKISPSEDDIKTAAAMGNNDLKPENVFDIYNSVLLILIANKGDKGRDFSKSSWTQSDKSHGVFIPIEFDSNNNPLKYRVLTEADRTNPTDELRKGLMWLMNSLQSEDINLKEQWMYKEPSQELLQKVQRSLNYIEFGNADYNVAQSGTTQPIVQTATQTAPAQTAPAQSAPAQTAPAQQVQTVTNATAPAQTATTETTETTTSNDADLLKQLGIG